MQNNINIPATKYLLIWCREESKLFITYHKLHLCRMSHQACWKANEHLIFNATFSPNISSLSSTHLLSASHSFKKNLSCYKIALFICWNRFDLCFVFLFLYYSFREENTFTGEYAISLLRSEWNLCNRKWTPWFQINNDIIKLIKVAFLILKFCLICVPPC